MSTTPTDRTTRLPETAPRRDPGARRAVRVLVVGLSLALVAWGALTLVSLMARDTGHRNASFSGVRTVDLDLGFESVRVTGDARATAVTMRRTWTWSLRAPTTSARVEGDRLVVTSRCGWDVGLGCAGSVRLVVPPSTAVRVRSGDGHVTVRGTAGRVDVHTGDGGIDASGLSGAVVLRTGDGSVQGSELRVGRVSARTGDGSVRLTFAAPPRSVLATTGDGSVDVAVPDDGAPWRVEATTGDGSRTVEVATDPEAPRRIEANTGDGSVRVGYR